MWVSPKGVIMTVKLTKDQAWALVNGTWTGGTPGTDNGDFKDLPGVNKGKALGDDDHVAGNENTNVIFGNGGCDFVRGGDGNDLIFGGK